MTFLQFTRTKMRSAWLRERGGLSLYVRRSFWPTRDYELANMSADVPGRGALTRFLDRYEPRFQFYVEAVLNPRLIAYLARRGYRCIYCHTGECTCLLAPNMIGVLTCSLAGLTAAGLARPEWWLWTLPTTCSGSGSGAW